nr:cysteine-rich receptor-like protein kinase [Tanacetum cinerariifolium]
NGVARKSTRARSRGIVEVHKLGEKIGQAENPLLKHLMFEEQELGKMEVGKPGVDKQERQELGFDFSCQEERQKNQEVEFYLTSSKDDSCDWWNNNCILVTLGGCLEQLSHSTLIGHRNYGGERWSSLNWGLKPFKVYNWWLEDPSCSKSFQNAWKASGLEGGAGFCLVKNELKEKFNYRFTLVMEEIKSKESRLFEVEALRQNDSLNEELWKEFVALKCSIRAFKTISEDESAQLESPFSEIVIKSTVWCCGEDRVQGQTGCFPKALNDYFIALFPKKLCPQDLNDFRPISFISSMYKVLVKVLAERLKPIIELVVGTSQFAFIKNMLILECILIANEVCHSLKYSKTGGMIFKIDFEKAYDTVEWVAVLINGSPTDFFQLKKGLRQGDPLSSFLFNIVSEGFNALISKVVQTGLRIKFSKSTLRRIWLIHRVSACVVEEIDKIRRSFFWEKDPSERKLCTIDWNTITKSKQNGGLGVGNLQTRNEALLCKWLWRYGNEKEACWKKLIDAKYGSNECSLSPSSLRKYFVPPLWKKISGKFSSKSLWYEVDNMNYHGNPLLSSIWKFKAPPKARLLCWQVLSGKLPIRDLLSRTGVISENHIECPLCCFGDVCKVERPSQWCPSDDGALKFNVDGSAKGKPSLAGIGVLL